MHGGLYFLCSACLKGGTLTPSLPRGKKKVSCEREPYCNERVFLDTTFILKG